MFSLFLLQSSSISLNNVSLFFYFLFSLSHCETMSSLFLLPDPTFISASLVKRTNDPDNEKIYIFFRERNSDHNPEADPWISRIARVCKVGFSPENQ